jgi:broad specificity phosphatase PhoE
VNGEQWAFYGVLATVLGGIVVEMVRTRRRAEKSAAELTPNGGSSLRDVADRIEEALTRVESKQQDHGERIAKIEGFIEGRATTPPR